MHSTYTVSALAVLGVFAAGYALGWITSLIRRSNSAGANSADNLLSPVDRSPDRPAVSSKTHLFEIRCKCGEMLKFRGANDTGTSSLPPFPEAESLSCPNCGAAINLRPAREIIQKQIASQQSSR